MEWDPSKFNLGSLFFCFVYKAVSYTIVCYTQTEGGDLCQILINKDP